jgi:hypothetical protein
MSGGLRFRAEAIPLTTKSFPAGTTALIAANTLIGGQRPGIYRVALTAAAAATFQFQDTANTVLSAVYSLPVGGIFIMNTPEGGDPLWQPAVPNLGLQIVVATSTITGDIWTALGA